MSQMIELTESESENTDGGSLNWCAAFWYAGAVGFGGGFAGPAGMAGGVAVAGIASDLFC